MVFVCSAPSSLRASMGWAGATSGCSGYSPSLLPIIYNAPTIYNVDRRERAGQGAGRAGQGRPPGGQLQEASLSLRGHLQLFRAELVELAGRRGDLVLPPVGNNEDEGQDGCEGNEETHVE